MLQFYRHQDSFTLENGKSIQDVQIAYHSFGTLNAEKNNVIWICHALTANSDVSDWWSGLVGEGKAINPEKHFIICANILGSCYGTTGPSSVDPQSGNPYGVSFPDFSIRDMVAMHQLLAKHLTIRSIELLVGGSMGGYQALEWTILEPSFIQQLFLLATSPAESTWGIGIHTAQRMAIEADKDWILGVRGKGDLGLKAARAIGMLSYRNYALFKAQQSENTQEKTIDFKVSSYLYYQAQKLADRFDAASYYKLTQAMDSHNIARGREAKMETVLQSIQHTTLLIGITSDILCPVEEQHFLAQHLPNCTYHEIDSQYGHDGFLIEYERIGTLLKDWML